jgi:hypothetical protein
VKKKIGHCNKCKQDNLIDPLYGDLRLKPHYTPTGICNPNAYEVTPKKRKPFMTYSGEILFKMLRYNEDLIKKILEEHYLVDGVTAVVVHGRDGQKYRVTVKPMNEYHEEN